MQAPTRFPQLCSWMALSVLALLLAALAPAALADDTEEVLAPRFSADGHYGVVAAGVGMLRDGAPGARAIQIDVPGTSVRAAYLYWSGYGTANSGDCLVELRRDADGESVQVSADPDTGTYGPAFWFDGYYYWSHVGDVTSLIRSGPGSYTVSDFGEMLHRRNGAGLVVVYEDAGLPLSRVELRDGLDRFHRGWGEGARGETAVNCHATSSGAAIDRAMDLWLIAAEVVRYGEEEPRPNALWYLTGSGQQPADLVNAPDNGPVSGTMLQGPPGDYPFASRDGLQWDTYHGSLPVPAGAGWVCLQVESAVDSRDPTWRPASGVLLAEAASLPLEEPPTSTPTATPSPTPSTTPTPLPPRPGIPVPVVPEASTLLLLGSAAGTLAGYVTLQWRARRRK